MRRAISAARLFTIRHLLGPVEIARLRMKPGDAVIFRITERVSPDEFYAVSRRAVALIPGHFHPLVVGPGLELSRLPREVLLELAEQAKPGRMPFGTTI